MPYIASHENARRKRHQPRPGDRVMDYSDTNGPTLNNAGCCALHASLLRMHAERGEQLTSSEITCIIAALRDLRAALDAGQKKEAA